MDLKNKIITYTNELKTRYGEQESYKVLVFKISVLLYPILKSLGVGSTAPVALVGDSLNDIDTIMYDLSGVSKPKIFSLADTSKDINNYLEDAEYELMLVSYLKSPNSTYNLQLLQSACQIGYVQENEFLVLPVVCFGEGIPKEVREMLAGQINIHLKPDFVIDIITNHNSGVEMSQMIIEYVRNNWSVIKLEISRLQENCDYQETIKDVPGVKMFFAVKRILDLILESETYSLEERQNYSEKYQYALKSIIGTWHIVSDNMNWLELIKQVILQSSTIIPGILDRKKVPAKYVKNIEFWPLYDEQFYYLSCKLLDELCVSLNKVISLKNIKELMTEEGVLVGEGKSRQYLTVKVPVVTEYGAIEQPRKIRIRREWLDLDGELTWKEIIEENSDGEVI